MDKKSAVRTSASNEASGRAMFEDRGNAIWEWQVKTGKFTREVCGEQVDKLTAMANLSLLATGRYLLADGRASVPGGNPYDHPGDCVRPKSTLSPQHMRELDAKIRLESSDDSRRRAAATTSSSAKAVARGHS